MTKSVAGTLKKNSCEKQTVVSIKMITVLEPMPWFPYGNNSILDFKE